MTSLAALFDDDALVPRFPVEAPDASRAAEIVRQTVLRRDLKKVAPSIMVYANANAGKRNPRQAIAEGVTAGVFDLTIVWNGGVAWIEMKGRDKTGRPGKLSAAQIEFGNRLVDRGMPCACFFDPVAAIAWLREIGAPVRAAL